MNIEELAVSLQESILGGASQSDIIQILQDAIEQSEKFVVLVNDEGCGIVDTIVLNREDQYTTPISLQDAIDLQIDMQNSFPESEYKIYALVEL